MLGIDDVLYKGSIIISLDKDNNIVGSALIELTNGVYPVELASEGLALIKNCKLIMSKLNKGNVIYIYNGNMYLGFFESRGPYCEEQIFSSFCDTRYPSFLQMLENLEFKMSNNKVKGKVLVRVGDYYENFNNIA